MAYGLDPETDGDNDGDGRRSLDQRRADLFTDLLLGPPLGQPSDSPNTATPPPSPGPKSRSSSTSPTLLRLADNPADMPGCGPVAAEIVRQLAADSKWRAWLTDTVGGQVIATSFQHLPTHRRRLPPRAGARPACRAAAPKSPTSTT